MNPKVVAKINKKTGVITIRSEGIAGEGCLLATKKLREGLGIEAEPDKTPEFYQEEVKQDLQQGT
jgi:DUF2997 family protein